MKNLKMRTAIMTIIAVTTFIGIGLLFALASSYSLKMIKNRSVDGMDTYLVAQTNSIESFVEESENKLLLFSKSDAVKNLLLNQSDEAAFNTAQQYTLDYYGTLNAWEGLYIGNWDTTVLTYNVPQVIGKTMREGERLEQLRNAMMDAVKNGNGVYDIAVQMDAIKAVSDQNNAGITGIVEKNNQSNVIAEEMMDVVKRNKESVEQLKEIVNRFTYC